MTNPTTDQIWLAIHKFVTDENKVDSFYTGTLAQFKQDNPLWCDFQSDQDHIGRHILTIMGQLHVEGDAPEEFDLATYTIQDSVNYIQSPRQQGTGT